MCNVHYNEYKKRLFSVAVFLLRRVTVIQRLLLSIFLAVDVITFLYIPFFPYVFDECLPTRQIPSRIAIDAWRRSHESLKRLVTGAKTISLARKVARLAGSNIYANSGLWSPRLRLPLVIAGQRSDPPIDCGSVISRAGVSGRRSDASDAHFRCPLSVGRLRRAGRAVAGSAAPLRYA